MEPPYARHVLQRTVVLPAHKVLFVPVPKAGCTSVLWRLAALAGLDAETFARSAMPEVSTALTVHDMSLWPPAHRLAAYDEDERARLLAEDGWLRFSLVRDPAPRLWSAWQSKLLLREPRFVETFGDADWFPRVSHDPALWRRRPSASSSRRRSRHGRARPTQPRRSRLFAIVRHP
jgi:hypothetical protein